jgi:hypothetical protein
MMRLPFVSRERLEEMQALLRADRMAALEREQAMNERYVALLDRLIALRRDGFGPAQPAPAGPTIAPMPDVVERVLADVLRGQPADIQRNARAKARQRLADGAEPSDVADEIERGDADRVGEVL